MSTSVVVMWAALWWATALAHRPDPVRRLATIGSSGRSVTRHRTTGRTARPAMIGRSRFVTAGLGLMALALVVAVGPRWAVALCSAAAALRWWRNRSQRRRHQRLIERHLVGVADLLAAALRSGLTCRLAVSVVGTRHPRAELVGLSEVHSLIERGVAPIEALERWSERGGSIRSLASLMVDAERTGAPLADDLCDFASRRRRELRRDAEERARRLPVTLLVPLVVCVLPAFVMVAVVPMLVTGATSLVFPS